jgi:predicted MPP superfamily phosphohydrolase
MASIGWLHLTDLHQGLTGQRWLWPAVRSEFFRDLEVLHKKSGPWDLVLFTGDLTQSGKAEEFKELGKTLEKLFERLKSLGSTPAFISVPGNHDLARPAVNSVVRALRLWDGDADFRDEFWSDTRGEYRKLIQKAFKDYDTFRGERPLPPGFTVKSGALPGDLSVSFEKHGLRAGVLGLNSAFLQLEGGDYKGRLDLDVRQLHAACDDDPPEWIDQHHVAILLTHHPTDWLSARALAGFKAEIAPPGRFLVHLHGHLHEGLSASTAIAGSAVQRTVQAPSLFGLEVWGDQQIQRSHGYMAARIEASGESGVLRVWPRKLQKNHAGAWQMVPDHAFALDEDNAFTETFKLRRAIASASPPASPASASATPKGPASVLSDSRRMREFEEALLSAFPNHTSLARMLRYEMDVNLAEIAVGGLRVVAFELLQWARAAGRDDELIRGALNQNPGNERLRAFALAVGVTPPEVASTAEVPVAPEPPPSPPKLTPVDRFDEATFFRELRDLFAALYPGSAQASRVCSDAGLNRGRIDLQGPAQIVWFNVFNEAKASDRVDRLVQIALAEYPQNPDLLRLTHVMEARSAATASVTSDALYDALGRLLPAQFEEVLFRMGIPAQYVSPHVVAQSTRAIEVVRFSEQQGRLRDLRAAIEKVGGRLR